MRTVFFLSKESGKRAEEILKKDDLTSRGSIALRESKTLGIEKEGYFLFFDGDEEMVKRARELLASLVEEIENAVMKEAEEKFEKENERALEGFGGIFG